MTAEHLFVYGTLRRAARHPMHRWLDQYAVQVGEATCQGRLYLVSSYPGLVPSAIPGQSVVGEVYRLVEPEIALRELDAYEGCGPHFPPPAQYLRQILPVQLPNGQRMDAWVYVYNRHVDERLWIRSGDFLSTEVRTLLVSVSTMGNGRPGR